MNAYDYCHIEHHRTRHGIEARCGYLIPWTGKNGTANAETGAAARNDRELCPECVLLTRLNDELKCSAPIEATALLQEADAVLGVDA